MFKIIVTFLVAGLLSFCTPRAHAQDSSLYIDQIGSNNTLAITQSGVGNQITGVGSNTSPIRGDLNSVTIRQGSNNNQLSLSLQGTGSNTLNLNQGTDASGNIVDDTGYHTQTISVSGYSNQVTTQQSGSVGHYLEANIVGNYNTVGIVQSDGTTQKQTVTNISGNNNVLNASQTGLGNHYLDVSLNGNGNSATVNQSGNTANTASISITNAGGPGSVNLTQTGGQNYYINTVCVQAGGCQPITVKQGN